MPAIDLILRYARFLPEGTLIARPDITRLGSLSVVARALQQLTRTGDLLRVNRGLYVSSIETRFGRGAPAVASIIASLEARSGDIIRPHGAAAVNALGLTTQVPAQLIFLTNGHSRKLSLRRLIIEVRCAPTWQVVACDGQVGMVVRALNWIGPEGAADAMVMLQDRLPVAPGREDDQGPSRCKKRSA